MATLSRTSQTMKPEGKGSKLWLKQCPKCQGDLFLDRDMYGPFVSCLQCGYYLNEGQMQALLAASTQELFRRQRQEQRMEEAALVA
ncbi:MAG: hypothetical protein HY532_03680 [Chloroflexi bacterium]|nr:hypothetical protein [Chloroflexota bacterium]